MNEQTKSEAHNQQPGVNATVTDKASSRLGLSVVDERHATTSGMNCNSQQGGCNPALEQATLNFEPELLTELTPNALIIYKRLLIGPITSGKIRDELKLLEYRRRLTEIRRALPPHQSLEKTYYPHRVVEWRIVEVR